jgi:hypothetical protein
MLDLFAGLGGASEAMRGRGWDVVTVDADPRFGCTVTADLSGWSWAGKRPDLIWASPPCTEFSREAMPWCRSSAAWVPCPCCENFHCTIHETHAHDCPCPPVEEWESDPYSVAAPSLKLVQASLRIVGEADPTWWVLENVKGAIRWVKPILGEPVVSCGPFFLWGRFPSFPYRHRGKNKESYSSARRAERAKIPANLSLALARACEGNLLVGIDTPEGLR